MREPAGSSGRAALVDRAARLAPQPGYNATGLSTVRILRSETVLRDVPVLYRPGAVFVLQGSKQGMLEGAVYRYDEEHYLAVSVPVPFRMESAASPARPLLAVYVDFDMAMAAEIAAGIEAFGAPEAPSGRAQSLVSSPTGPEIEDVLMRLLTVLSNPAETAILGPGILRELHYRVFVGPQGAAMIATLQQKGMVGRIVRSLARIRETYAASISVAALAGEAGMSIPSYHAHFRALTGSTPIQYIKAMRLHEARLMIARSDRTIAEVAAYVGYVSPAQFSRDFRRLFGRTASNEAQWVRRHLGEMVSGE
ncbi:AraC family transcriptional regulator [Rhizobium halophytocola]|uniref:AraC-like DNA-binding protein n=1 Tax=Rhizobium halophytocola TaxID=735519 RepID=A0ABS4E5T7_9HYPH|nr:AraC family transcriptional regulator [Rhizobium halophytocola]MBP1853281.1 AraC-like DNA-binding protein [Rhizobium halophytocola]